MQHRLQSGVVVVLDDVPSAPIFFCSVRQPFFCIRSNDNQWIKRLRKSEKMNAFIIFPFFLSNTFLVLFSHVVYSTQRFFFLLTLLWRVSGENKVVCVCFRVFVLYIGIDSTHTRKTCNPSEKHKKLFFCCSFFFFRRQTRTNDNGFFSC